MTEQNSAQCYRDREKKERALAQAAIDPSIAAIHHDFAARYCELVIEAERATLVSRPRRSPEPART